MYFQDLLQLHLTGFGLLLLTVGDRRAVVRHVQVVARITGRRIIGRRATAQEGRKEGYARKNAPLFHNEIVFAWVLDSTYGTKIVPDYCVRRPKKCTAFPDTGSFRPHTRFRLGRRYAFFSSRQRAVRRHRSEVSRGFRTFFSKNARK